MAFVKAALPAVAPPSISRDAQLAGLSVADRSARRAAACALAGDGEAAPALAARLCIEADSSVVDALFASLIKTGGAAVADLIAPLLRSGDAGLRNGALDALKLLDDDAVPAVDMLLQDTNPDVRLLATEVMRAWPSALAAPRLAMIIETDPHVNVCGAAVDVATEVGTGALLQPLAVLKARFADEPFLVFAISVASARLAAADGAA